MWEKMVVLLFIVLASTIFTCRSYEYQIILAKTFIIGIIFAHPIELYPYRNIMAGIDWVDPDPHQGTQERSYMGDQIPISSSTYSHWMFYKTSSTQFLIPTPLSFPLMWCYYLHLLCPPQTPYSYHAPYSVGMSPCCESSHKRSNSEYQPHIYYFTSYRQPFSTPFTLTMM